MQIDIFCPDMLTARQGAQLLIPEAFQRHWKVHYTPREAGEVNLERPINYCLDTHPGDIAVAGKSSNKQVVRYIIDSSSLR